MQWRITIGCLILGVSLLLAAWGITEFLAIDTCLDSGGGYDYAARRCAFDEQPLGEPNKYDILAFLLGSVLSLVGGIVIFGARGNREGGK